MKIVLAMKTGAQLISMNCGYQINQKHVHDMKVPNCQVVCGIFREPNRSMQNTIT